MFRLVFVVLLGQACEARPIGHAPVVHQVLEATRMVVTEGLGDGHPAKGCVIIVGNSNEIFADECRDPERPDIKICKYGHFRTDMDRRSVGLKISDCLGKRKRSFLKLCQEDGAIVVDDQTGRVCCGGFFVHDSAIGCARTTAPSTMSTQAGGCCVVVASEAICGCVGLPVPAGAMLTLFNRTSQAQEIPVLNAVVEDSLMQWLCPFQFGGDLHQYHNDFAAGTREWILDDLEAWCRDLDGSPCRVLLAGPGFGKTAIAARFYHESSCALAIHLCRHNEWDKNEPRRMIASIAYQIAEALPQFKEALRAVRDLEEAATTDAYSLRRTARELAECLLFSPLRDIQPPPSYFHDGRQVIIIDALDEADQDTKDEILDLVEFDLNELPPWIAVLITARPEVDIGTRLAPFLPTVLDAEAHRDKCDDDVRIYLRTILAPRFRDEGSLINAIDTIAAKSEGLFLYLRYIRTMLQSEGDIQTLPSGLAELYQQQLERALGPTGLGDEKSQTRRVVEAIVAAQVPVHVYDELPGLSGVPYDEILRLLTRLSLFLPVRADDRIYNVHKSFVDWLTCDDFSRTCDKSEFMIDRSAAHRRLASVCAVPLMRLLSAEAALFESDARAVSALEQFVKARGRLDDDSQQSLGLDEYALRWSVTHLMEAGDFKDVGLALLGSLQFLMKRVPQIDTVIADAVMLFPETALLYSALSSARKHMRIGRAQWLPEELWQRLLYPAQARGAVHIERLACDARIKARAESMFSAREPCLRLAGGSCQFTFESHSLTVADVTSFVDAKGQTWVASCSYDKTIRIWDPIKGGEAVHVLEGHSEWVRGLTAFVDAMGNTYVASCSNDKTIRIWDAIKGGKAVRVLEGHSNWVIGVTAFVDAQGRTWLASCSWDDTIRIWDPIMGGQAVHVLEDHYGGVNGVAAFQDAKGNTWLASCSDDKTVCIWDPIKGGEAVHVLEGHSEVVKGVTAFIDATGQSWVASCSEDKTVRIWDPIKGGEAVRVLEGHSDFVNSVTTFVDAKDRTWLATCSEDKSVRIWDPIRGGRPSFVIMLDIQPRAISPASQSLSPGAAQAFLVIGALDGRLSYWDYSPQCEINRNIDNV